MLLLLSLVMVSCYSFTGSSLKPDVKTINIKNFPNNTAFNPNLSQQFTVDLQNRFLQRTTLKGTKENPDILIEGEITDYNISPTTISSPTTSQQSGNVIQAAQNKLTITVKVHYENAKYPEESFDRTYSDEVVYNNNISTQGVENSQVKIATDRIINKIFNDIVANW
ncbi:LptE family protein [Elizabethkingia sp. JS20170427COW]|uniref:LptE family protein n=1 Tax=Elizabethkingia sp. JS20170427COW TaxID=2583851 RepID=UPI0021022DA3|nr:LptE family protein [Elizabethkingia sp. JS20170427COW]